LTCADTRVNGRAITVTNTIVQLTPEQKAAMHPVTVVKK
jgi:hypothetical protein